MRPRTLLTQVLAVNALLVATTALVATAFTSARIKGVGSPIGLAVLILAVLSVILLNSVLLRHRLRPLEKLVDTMDAVDLAVTDGSPDRRAQIPEGAAEEVQRLTVRFNAMLDRLQEERHGAARAVLRAQELERQRLARDLHDEVNQSLTGIKLRMSALVQDAPAEIRAELADVQALTNTAMGELLRLTRELRPTALDDHGLIPALRSQVADFAARTGIEAEFRRTGAVPELTDEQQLVVFRVTQESLTNVAQHAAARRVNVELSVNGATTLRVVDDGAGFASVAKPRSLGLSGMRERALLVGGDLAISSRPGEGTIIELTMGRLT